MMNQPENPYKYEKFKVEKIEREKQKTPVENSVYLPDTLLFALCVLHIKNFLHTSLPPDGTPLLFADLSSVLEALFEGKQLLLLLTKQDVSYQIDFIEQLSNTWHKLLHAPYHLKSELDPVTLVKLKFFLTTLSHYPPGEEHTVGFYLTASAGKDWTPFPFMEILHQLYEEHQNNPTTSTLSNWLRLLSELSPETTYDSSPPS